ncbi:ARM repeat-containing protein [Hypomontagnella monticulosa]|nr:ARM repeat-containing protein [Hypomontagnella monticulosa]
MVQLLAGLMQWRLKQPCSPLLQSFAPLGINQLKFQNSRVPPSYIVLTLLAILATFIGFRFNRKPPAQPPNQPTEQPFKQGRAVHLRRVYPPGEDDAETDTDVDIIAIHGLDTASPRTWTWVDRDAPNTPGVNWLQDRHMLPSLVGRARIFTCDWPADLYESSELIQKRIEELSRLLLVAIKGRGGKNRPIIFIASCLGGITLMRVLNNATDEYSSIKEDTRGVIFLATPFEGTSFQEIAYWVEPFLNTRAWIQGKTVNKAIKDVSLNDNTRELVLKFTQLSIRHKYQMYVFYEELPTDLGRQVPFLLRPFFSVPPPKPLVGFTSAALQSVPNPIPLKRYHSVMNKFKGPDKESDLEYKVVAEKVEDILENIRKGAPFGRECNWIRNEYYTEDKLNIKRLSGDKLPMEQCYINLVIVARGGENTTNTTNQSSPFSLHSRLKIETPAEELQYKLATLFDRRKIPNGEIIEPRRLLIRGRAGVGKTTLCKKAIYDFLHKNIWGHLFNHVFWIPLRDLKGLIHTHNIGEMISHLYFRHFPERTKLANNVWDALKGTAYRDSLFILDGLDEVSEFLYEGDETPNLLLVLLKLPNIIIATRPYTTLPSSIDMDLELDTIGFYPDQVQCYLENVLQGPREVQKIQSYLRKHQLIESLVRIPIQLDALCLAWDNKFEELQLETMTSIYKAIVHRLWEKDIVRLRKIKNPEAYVKTAQKKDIERATKYENRLLECLAFSGMYNNVVEFQPYQQEDLSEIVELDSPGLTFYERLGRLSFLRSADSPAEISKRSYHFLHLTFQEFFAAQYFARQWKSGNALQYLDFCRNAERSCISPEAFLRQNKYNARYDIVWRFVVGLLKAGDVQHFFGAIEQEPHDLLGSTHQRLVMHCLSEAGTLTDRPYREKMERKLSQWLLFECDWIGWKNFKRVFPLFSQESEFPDEALRIALGDCSLEQKTSILYSLDHPNRYLSEARIETLERLSHIESGLKLNIIGVLGSRSNLPERIIATFVRLLKDSNDADTRFRASKAIKNQSTLSEESVATLITLFEVEIHKQIETQDKRMTFNISTALGNQTSLPKEAITRLLTLFWNAHNSESFNVIENVLIALRGQVCLPEEIITTLLAMLEIKNGAVQDSARKILANQLSISERNVTGLVGLLQSPNRGNRAYAAKALKEKTDLREETVKTLLELIENGHSPSRDHAAEVLAFQSNLSKETKRTLEALAENSDFGIRYAPATALNQQLDLSEQSLLNLLKKGTSEMQPKAWELLKQSHLQPGTIMELITLLKTEGQACKYATELLGAKPSFSEGAIAALEQLLEDKDLKVRKRAVIALGQQSNLSPRALNAIMILLKDEVDESKIWSGYATDAAKVLGEQQELPREITTTLAIMLRDKVFDKYADEHYLVADVLAKQSSLPDSVIAALMELLEDPDRREWGPAALALHGQSNVPEKAITALTRILKRTDGLGRDYAIQLLGKQSKLSEEVIEIILPLLDTSRQKEGGHLAAERKVSTEVLTDRRFLPEVNAVIMRLLKDADPKVRRHTARIVGQIPKLSDGVLEANGLLLKTNGAAENELPTYIDPETVKYLYGVFIRRSFYEQFCLHVNGSNLRIDQSNGSRYASLKLNGAPKLSSDVIAEWRQYWNPENYELW